jgi:hypothetical protein
MTQALILSLMIKSHDRDDPSVFKVIALILLFRRTVGQGMVVLGNTFFPALDTHTLARFAGRQNL